MGKISQHPPADDSVRWETRALAAVIVPFLIAAFVILYLRPQDAASLFAWPIAPTMTSFVLASAYMGGAYFFVRVLFEGSWHRIAVGFLPVTVFATLMLGATLLHWDRFTHDSIAFVTWVVLYATTPLLVCAAWLRNRGSDTGVPDPGSVATPPLVRGVMGVLGAVVLTTGLVLFAFPALLTATWPWQLTPLTARVIGSCFALTGVFGLVIARDHRWTAARIALQSQTLGVVLILIGIARAWSDFRTARPTTWLFVAGMAALLVAISAVYVTLERRRLGSD